MPTTWSSPTSVMPRTPIAVRPIGRTSVSSKRTDLPLRVAISTWLRPVVRAAAISSSSGSRLMAMIPPRRGLENAERSVFFTMPWRVHSST